MYMGIKLVHHRENAKQSNKTFGQIVLKNLVNVPQAYVGHIDWVTPKIYYHAMQNAYKDLGNARNQLT